MKVDLQNFRYRRLKNIKMDGILEGDLLLLLLLRRQRKKSPSQSFKMYQTYVLGEKYLQKAWKTFPYSPWPAYHTGRKCFTFSANISSSFKLNWFAIFFSLLATRCFFLNIVFFIFFSQIFTSYMTHTCENVSFPFDVFLFHEIRWNKYQNFLIFSSRYFMK